MKQVQPPIWILWVIRLLIKSRYLEQIEGDLFELFERDTNARLRKLKFIWNALGFFRWRYIKGINDFQQLTTLAMISNYLKIAFRTLSKQKSYSGITILGLSVGLASCLLIMVYINHERSFDKFYPDADRVYRVVNGTRGAYTPPLLAQTMISDLHQVESATRMSGLWESYIKVGDHGFLDKGAAWADENIFEVFKMEFVAGDPKNALSATGNVVFTESLAAKCFPNELAVGKTVDIDGTIMKITAVVKDPPRNTHFPFSFIGSNNVDPLASNNWSANNFWTYAKIHENADPKEIDLQMMKLFAEYAGPELLGYTGHSTFEELMAAYPDRHWGFSLLPMTGIHLDHPHLSMGARGNAKNIVIFSLVAFFILLIACVNYINLATARSALRSKEVGIRKALGSYRKDIIVQFLVESMVVTAIAIILAIIVSTFIIPYFNDLTGRDFNTNDLFTPVSIISIIVLLLIVGLLAGVYPAYVISGFSPLKALRGHSQSTSGNNGFRGALVAFQFAISIFLSVVTIIIYNQLQYMQSQDLGISIDQTLIINNGRELGDKYDIFKAQLEAMSNVETVGKASNIPFHGYGDWTYSHGENEAVSPMNAFVSPDIQEILDIEMLSGRFFEKDRVTDTASVVINEALAKKLGWDDPLGKRLNRDVLEFTVIGVMRDFNYASLKREIEPMIFRYGVSSMEIGDFHQSYALAKINTESLETTLSEIESKWQQLVPNYPFDAVFMSDSFQQHYESERKFGQVFTTFSMIALSIAFLGLFALTTFVLQKRFKEIAIRKVMGASVPSILRMIIKEFTILVILGGAAGVILSYYWLSDWLQGYSYRIELEWYLFVIPIILVMLLTWLLVSIKSYKAAQMNPANVLKEE